MRNPSRLATAGPSLSVTSGALRFPGRLNLPRPGRLGAALLASLLFAYVVATSVPAVISAASSPATPAPAVAAGQEQGLLDKLPVSFEQNVGQVDPQVRYLSRFGVATVFLTSSSAVFATSRGDLAMNLVGANPNPAMTGTSKLPGNVNYLSGSDASTWHTSISTYKGVTSKGVYPGVDLAWHGTGTNLEYDFTVAPGVDPARIAFDLKGARAASLAPNGDLLVTMADGSTVRQKAPTLYQETAGRRTAISGGFRLQGDLLSFRVGTYDQTRPLVIDPIVYSTYLGGSNDDSDGGQGVARDPAGNVYLTGSTRSANFPGMSPSSFQPALKGTLDPFVIKVDPTGTTILYATYLGGGTPVNNSGFAIKVDASGQAHVFGTTPDANFPTTPGAAQPSAGGGGSDYFVTVLNAAGTGLVWSTYLGGNSLEQAPGGVALDGAGNTYVAAASRSANYPVKNAFTPTRPGTQNIVVTVFNPAGAILWSTYLGGFGQDTASGIAVDGSGSIYVSGSTTSFNPPAGRPSFPTTPGAYETAAPVTQSALSPLVFVTKFASGGGSLVYSTLLPGNGANNASFGLAVDAAGDAAVVGRTDSSDLATVNPLSCCTAPSANLQGFVTVLNPAGNGLVFSSGLSPYADSPRSPVFDTAGNLYMVGTVNNDNNGQVNFQSVHPLQPCIANDIWAMKITPLSSTVDYAFCLGGTNAGNAPTAATLDAAGNLHLTGNTASTDYPVSSPAIQSTNGGGQDAVLTKLSDPSVTATSADLSVAQAPSASPAAAGSALTYSITVSNAGPDDARGAGFVDTLPAGVIFQSASTGAGTCGQSAGIVTCSLGTIPSGGSASASVVVEPVTAGTVTNTVTANAADPDSSLANNASTVATSVTGSTTADLAVTQTGSPNPVTQAFPLTYAISVANNGPNDTTGATVTEALPASVTFSSASSSQGSCANASGSPTTVTCSLGTLLSGATATATVVGTPTAAGTATATATVTSIVADPNPANSTAAVTTTVNPPSADLSVTLSASPVPATAGSSLTYSIATRNNGPSPATGATATDVLPAGVTFGTAASGCTNASGTVTCTLGTLNAGATVTRTVTVTPQSAGILVDTASVSSTVSDPSTANNSTSLTTAVNPAGGGSTLPTVVVAAPPAVALTGPAASAVNVTASCPGGSTLVGGGSFLSRTDGSTPGNGLKLNGSVPSDASGNPAAGGSANPGSWTTVAGFGGQSDTGDQAQAFALCATSGGPTSTVVVTNSVTGTATENLPTGNPPLTTTATCPSGTRLIGGGSLGTPPSEPSFKPVASYPSDASSNPATGGSSNPNSWTAFGSAGAPSSVQVVSVFALCSNNAALNTQVARTDTAGPQSANTFTTTSVACPSGTQLLDGGVRIDENANLQPQQGVHVRGTYPSDASGVPAANGSANPASWTNVVQAGGQNTPGINVHSFALCALAAGSGPSADLSLTKTASPTTPTQGANVTYTLTTTNAGPGAASGATVTDTLPSGESFVSASSTQGSCSFSAPTIICNLGSLANAASATMTVVATATQAGTVTNTATVAATTPDPTTSNNSATATVTVTASADLSLTKTGPANAFVSIPVTYTVVATNNGPSAATGATVTDTLPANLTFNSATSTQGTCTGTTTLSCTLGALASGASATITVVATPNATGSATNAATASANESDPNTNNNTATTTAAVFPSPLGLLRVTTTPAVPTRISLVPQGSTTPIPMDQWGLNWVRLNQGTYTLSFSDVPGYETPAPQQVTITGGATTVVNGAFTQDGFLRVQLSPAGIEGTISIDGQAADDYGYWSYLAPGTHQVCYSNVANFTPPPCQTTTVTAGTETDVTGTYTSNPGAPFPTNFGLLRVTTSPSVPTRVMLTPQGSTTPIPMDQWGLNWVRLTAGTYTLSFSGVPGYEAPAPQQVTITDGATTVANGSFTTDGYLRVQLSPAGADGTISVNGTARDDFGMWNFLPPATYQVCFSPAPGYSITPSCQNATVAGTGAETDVTGTYQGASSG